MFDLTKCLIIEEIEQSDNFKMSAELEWYKKFHDIIKPQLVESDYNEIVNSMFSENDR